MSKSRNPVRSLVEDALWGVRAILYATLNIPRIVFVCISAEIFKYTLHEYFVRVYPAKKTLGELRLEFPQIEGRTLFTTMLILNGRKHIDWRIRSYDFYGNTVDTHEVMVDMRNFIPSRMRCPCCLYEFGQTEEFKQIKTPRRTFGF